jgi:hypothetical protein
VFSVFRDEGEEQARFHFQVRRSIFADGFKNSELLPPVITLINEWYQPGGHDQIAVEIYDLTYVLGLLELPWFRRAAKDMNLNLMRKGANLYASNHCFALIDAIWRMTPKLSLESSLTQNLLTDDSENAGNSN